MEISDSEKLIITMLADIMKHNKVESELDPQFISDAIYGGHHWALEWKSPGLFGGPADTEEEVKETVDILKMWTSLEQAYEKLDDDQKKDLETKAGPFGKNIKFLGFDGNSETEYMGIACFMIEKMDRFSKFNDNRALNSHGSSSLQIYRGMLKEFLPIQDTKKPDSNWTVDEMAQVLKPTAVF